GDDHSRRAKAALQTVFPCKCVAQFRADLVLVESFNGCDLGHLAGNCKGDARTHRHAIDQDRAGAAHAMLASDMRSGQRMSLAQQIGQAGARLDVGLEGATVDDKADSRHCICARSTARRRATTWIWRSMASTIPALSASA